jgi:hypothetical protein
MSFFQDEGKREKPGDSGSLSFLDADGDEVVSPRAIEIALRWFRWSSQRRKKLQMIVDADSDSNGMISWPVSIQLMTQKRKGINSDEETAITQKARRANNQLNR